MISQISSGIRISVEVRYLEDYSNSLTEEYFFGYQIIIENHNPFPVQLLSRYWEIFDSIGETSEVEGEGVVGNQPIIGSGESYQYISQCPLRSEIGKMKGKYVMENCLNKSTFETNIPTFDLIAPHKLN